MAEQQPPYSFSTLSSNEMCYFASTQEVQGPKRRVVLVLIILFFLSLFFHFFSQYSDRKYSTLILPHFLPGLVPNSNMSRTNTALIEPAGILMTGWCLTVCHSERHVTMGWQWQTEWEKGQQGTLSGKTKQKKTLNFSRVQWNGILGLESSHSKAQCWQQ